MTRMIERLKVADEALNLIYEGCSIRGVKVGEFRELAMSISKLFELTQPACATNSEVRNQMGKIGHAVASLALLYDLHVGYGTGCLGIGVYRESMRLDEIVSGKILVWDDSGNVLAEIVYQAECDGVGAKISSQTGFADPSIQ